MTTMTLSNVLSGPLRFIGKTWKLPFFLLVILLELGTVHAETYCGLCLTGYDDATNLMPCGLAFADCRLETDPEKAIATGLMCRNPGPKCQQHQTTLYDYAPTRVCNSCCARSETEYCSKRDFSFGVENLRKCKWGEDFEIIMKFIHTNKDPKYPSLHPDMLWNHFNPNSDSALQGNEFAHMLFCVKFLFSLCADSDRRPPVRFRQPRVIRKHELKNTLNDMVMTWADKVVLRAEIDIALPSRFRTKHDFEDWARDPRGLLKNYSKLWIHLERTETTPEWMNMKCSELWPVKHD